jgi:dTDP-glucose pyrophosphorylase
MRNTTVISVDENCGFICDKVATIGDVMARFNVSSHHFILVIDATRRLLGTVTDGDLRRALLQPDITTAHSVTICMQAAPLIGQIDESELNEAKLWRLDTPDPFLPIVNTSNQVVEVLVADRDARESIFALVMAGGFGRRLGEKTKTKPKPLLPIGEKPILGHILDQLERAGISKIYIAVHHLADQISQFIADRENTADICLIEESMPLGTAGAISLLPEDISGDFLVINGDVMSKVDIEQLRDMHRRNLNDATIAVARYEVEIPYGIVQHDEAGQFLGVAEKPKLNHFVAAGIYVLSSVVKSLVQKNTYTDMPELLNEGRSIGLKIGLFPLHEYWIDIGQLEDFETAQKDHNESC